MTRYYIFTGDKNFDQQWCRGQDNQLDIQLGFDEEFIGYWLTIEDCYYPAKELENYIFHHIRDVEDVRMTLSEIEQKLAEYGVGIPYQLAVRLVVDGIEKGYLAYINNQKQYKKTKEFKEFYQRSLNSSPEMWQPNGKLPYSWGVS